VIAKENNSGPSTNNFSTFKLTKKCAYFILTRSGEKPNTSQKQIITRSSFSHSGQQTSNVKLKNFGFFDENLHKKDDHIDPSKNQPINHHAYS
jgi:hypothetical protein